MKKVLSFISILIVAFSAVIFTACAKPYEKVYLEVYDANGAKLNLDENYNYVLETNSENLFSLTVKVRGLDDEIANVEFTRRSTTSAFDIASSRTVQVVDDQAQVTIKGEHAGSGKLYARISESNIVKEIEIPIKIVKKLTSIEANPLYNTAVMVGNSTTLSGKELIFTPGDTNEKEITYTLKNNVSEKIKLNSETAVLTVDSDYDLANGKEVVVTATSKSNPNLSTDFVVNIVESLTVNDVEVKFDKTDANIAIEKIDGVDTPVVTLVKGASQANYKSTTLSVSVASSYDIDSKEGLSILAYTGNSQVVSVSGNISTDTNKARFLISSELLAGDTVVSFKVSFAKFRNLEPIVKEIVVRVVDLPTDLFINDVSSIGATNFDFDVYTEYTEKVKGLALKFSTSYNVPEKYQQVFLEFVAGQDVALLSELLVINYYDQYGILRKLNAIDGKYAVPNNTTIYISLNPNQSGVFANFMENGIKMNAWIYKTIDRFDGDVVTRGEADKIIAPITLNVKYGITGINAYVESVGSKDYSEINGNVKLIARDIVSGAPAKVILLDFTPTGLADVNKNIAISSTDVSVVKFVVGGTVYSEITGNQLVELNADIVGQQTPKKCYSLVVRGFGKGIANIEITTGNGITKTIGVESLVSTSSLTLKEKSVSGNIKYSTTKTTTTGSFSVSQFNDVIIPLGSSINLTVVGNIDNADISIAQDSKILTSQDEAGLSDSAVVSLYVVGNQLFINALQTGTNKISLTVYCYTIDGLYTSYNISFYIYTYIPVSQFALSTDGETLYQNTGYYERSESEISLKTIFNKETATESITLMSTGEVLNVFTIQRTINPSLFEGSNYGVDNLTKDNAYNINLRLTNQEISATSTVISVDLKEFGELVSSKRCNLTIKQAVKVDKVIVSNVSKKSGAYVVKLDIRDGFFNASNGKTLAEYVANADNNFKQILTLISNAETATYPSLEYKIVNYVDEQGVIHQGSDGSVEVYQNGNEFYVVPVTGGEVVMHIFPHDSYYTADRYDLTKAIEITIQVSDGDKVPFQVGTLSQLLAIGNDDVSMGYKYQLSADINLNNKGAYASLPIGGDKAFTGKLSGAYTIAKSDGSKLTIQYYLRNAMFTMDQEERFAGLFSVNRGELTNIFIENARYSVNSIELNANGTNNYYLGGIAGKNEGIIENCYVQYLTDIINVNTINFNLSAEQTYNLNIGGITGENTGTISSVNTMVAGNLLVNITRAAGVLSNKLSTYIGGVVGNNSGIVSGNYICEYQQYKLVTEPTEEEYNRGLYYILSAGVYTLANAGYDANAEYYAQASAPLTSNLNILDENITSSVDIEVNADTWNTHVGGIVGSNTNTITNVAYSGDIDVTGIVGKVNNNNVGYAGGLVGVNNAGKLTNSLIAFTSIVGADNNVNIESETIGGVAYTSLYGAGVVGGAVGYGKNGEYNLLGAQYMTGTDNLTNRTSIQGYGYVGGLIGYSENETLSFGYAESFYKQYINTDVYKQHNITKDIVGIKPNDDTATFAGGLIGYANGTTIKSSYAKINLYGDSYSDGINEYYANVGGLLGNSESTMISDVYYKGNLFGNSADMLVSNGSANITSSYAIGSRFIEYFENNYALLVDEYNKTDVAYMYNIVGNGDNLSIIDGAYDFTSLTNSMSTNLVTDPARIWYMSDIYNDGHPVQLCNRKVFSTLIPTQMNVELLADDSNNILYKAEANKSNVTTKNLIAGYKYDDTTAVIFYRTGSQISEYANYLRLEDIIGVTVSPRGAEDYVAFSIVSGNARLATVQGKTCLVLNSTGKVVLKVYALYNSSLYIELTFYVANGISEFSLYNTTDISSRQNLLNNGKTLTLATDSATTFVPVIRFGESDNLYQVSTDIGLNFSTSNSAYTVVDNPTALDRDKYYFKDAEGKFVSAENYNFDANETYYVESENFTINGLDATGNFKANENMRIDTISGEQFYDGKVTSTVSVVPYLDMHSISTDFAEGEKIELSTMSVDFSIAVCKRATAVISNYASRSIRSSGYANINVSLQTDFVSPVSADLSAQTLIDDTAVTNTDALRLDVSVDEDSAEYVQSLLDRYGLTDAKQLFNLSCYVEVNAFGIVYKELRIEMKEEYKYITQNIGFVFHFYADSNIKACLDFVLNIAPSVVSKINMLHYTETVSNTQLGGNTLTNIEQNSATNMIEPGKSGLMVVKVNPIYANVDYFTIQSSTVEEYTIAFEQLVKYVDANGKTQYTTLFPRPSMPRLNKASELDANGNVIYTGELYVRTLLPTIVAKELNFEVVVDAYINGVAESIKSGSVALLTSYVPSITMTVDPDDAVSVYDYQEVDHNILNKDSITSYYINNNGKYQKAVVYDKGITYYTRETYYLIENYSNNITINMEVIGYEFGRPAFSVTPSKEGLSVFVPIPAFALNESGAYVGTSNITVSSVNKGETFNIESEILVTRNGITKKSSDILKFIVVENLIRPGNVTLDNLSDDGVLSMAMGSSMPLDLRWLTDSGSIDFGKEEVINNTLYEDIAGTGINADYQKVLSLFYVKRNTVNGVEKEPLQLGSDRSNIFKINQNMFVDNSGVEKFNGFSLIGTSQTTSTVFGFSVYYYYVMTDSGIELNFTTDFSLNQDYILTEINFEFTLLVYFNSTEKEPLPIYTASQFKSYLSTPSAESYILMDNITLQDYEPFNAEFVSLDGNGKTIRIINFTPTNPDTESVAQIGLFKEVKTDTLIKNVALDISGLRDINVSAYEGYKLGLLAVKNSGVITNCDVVSLRDMNAKAITKEITITSKAGATTEQLAGFVVENVGNITNSRFGVAYFDGYRISVANNIVLTTQTRYFSDDVTFNAKGHMAGFVYSNSGVISSSYARGISLNNTSTDMDVSKTAGFVVNNASSGRIYYSYVKGSGSINSVQPRITTNLIKSNGDVAGFVSTNSGYIGDSYANIAVYSVAKFTAGFVGSNSSSGRIQRSYSACDIVSNAPSMMPFTGENLLHEIQDQSNGGIKDCYYLILSGEYFDAEDDSATGMSLTSFQVSNTLNGYSFIDSSDKIEKASGVWTYGAENIADSKAIVVDSYNLLPDLTSPNIIAKSVRYLETELTNEEGTVVGYVYQYVKDFEYGSQANPYIIRSAKEYNTVFADALTDDVKQTVQVLSHVRFVKDIDFLDVGNEVKTRERVVFSGSIDGNGMQINNISITSNTTDKSHDSLGMFSKVIKSKSIHATTPVIKNLTLNFTKVSGTSMTYVGGLAGVIENAIIINLNLTGGVTVQAYNFGGGLAGLITGDTRLMNINSNLSVSVGKSNHAVDSYNNYIPYVYYSYEDYAKINTYATQATYAKYMQQLSYGGGLAGVIDIYSELNVKTLDLSKPNVYLVNINVDASKDSVTTLGSSVSVFADVVGGIAGYLGESTFMASTKYYINASANSTSYLEGYYVVGGLVGENYGKITVSEAIAQLDSQYSIDVENGKYYRAETDTMSGNLTAAKGSYFVGGLIGINYQGVVEHCDTRLSLVSAKAKYVGGLIGATLGGSFNTMFTTSIMPIATDEGCYTGGFAAVVFDSKDQKSTDVEVLQSPLYFGNYIGDYLDLKNIVPTDEMEVMMNRVVSSAYYDRTELAEVQIGDTHNGALIGYSSMIGGKYRGSQLDSLYTSAEMPTECYVNESYVVEDGRTISFNIIAHKDSNASNFDNEVETFDIANLTAVDDVEKQRPEFQKVFSEWNLSYWSALDETKIYPRLLQIGFGSVIEITKESDFQYIFNNPAGTYIITQDIQLTNEYTDCIIGVDFKGRITGYKPDGTAPTVYGIKLTGSSVSTNCLSFFHSTTGATISNINFRYLKFDAQSKDGNVAGLIATDNGGTTVSEVSVGFSTVTEEQATVEGYTYTNEAGYEIKAPYATHVAGLIAESHGTSIINCTSRMNIITDGVNVGGLVGISEVSEPEEGTNIDNFITSIVNSYYGGKISCTEQSAKSEHKYVGGVVGQLIGGSVNNSVAQIEDEDKNITYSSIIECTLNDSTTYVGGIVGAMTSSGNISAASVTSCKNVKVDIIINQNLAEGNLYMGYIVGNATGSGDNYVSVTSSSVKADSNIRYVVATDAQTKPLEVFALGGLIGQAQHAEVKDCEIYANTGNINTATGATINPIRAKLYYMGQSIGRVTGIIDVSGVLATGNIDLYAYADNISHVGGLIGQIAVVAPEGVVSTATSTEKSKLITSAYFGTITVQHVVDETYVGGIVGSAKDATIQNCQSACDIVVQDAGIHEGCKVGGVVGSINGESDITTCVMLSYFKMARDMSSSDVVPFAHVVEGEGTNVVMSGNIYSADYSFIADPSAKKGCISLLASQMMGYGITPDNNPSKSAVAYAMSDGNAASKIVVLHGETSTIDTIWKMCGYKAGLGDGVGYIMPYIMSLEDKLYNAGLFNDGSKLRPKIISSIKEVSSGVEGVFILTENAVVDSTIDSLAAKIVGCQTTLTLNNRLADTIAETGGISGVIIGKPDNIAGVDLSTGQSAASNPEGAGLIANYNQGKIFDITFIDTVIVSGTIPMGMIAYVNEGTIYGCGISSDVVGSDKRPVAGIAYFNTGRIENSFVTADLSKVAKNDASTAGLVYANTNTGYMSNMYFAGTLVNLTDAITSIDSTPGIVTNTGNIDKVYVDVYSNNKKDAKIKSSDNVTTRYIQEQSVRGISTAIEPCFDDNVWARYCYTSSGYINGNKEVVMNSEDAAIKTLNYGYPLLDLGTQKYNNANNVLESTFIGRTSGSGTAEDPLQVINLGTLDYMRSLGSNPVISNFSLERDVFVNGTISGYSLTSEWGKDADETEVNIYGANTFTKIFDGKHHKIKGLNGGALFKEIAGHYDNAQDNYTNGIVRNIKLENFNTLRGTVYTGIVANTLTSALVSEVIIYGNDNRALAGVVEVMAGDSQINGVEFQASINYTNNDNKSVAGVCHQMNGGTITGITFTKLSINAPSVNAASIVGTMSNGNITGLSGENIYIKANAVGGMVFNANGGNIGQDVSTGYDNVLTISVDAKSSVGGVANILSGATISSNAILLTLDGSNNESTVGGLVQQVSSGEINKNLIQFGAGSDIKAKNFGGLVGSCENATSIIVSDNELRGTIYIDSSSENTVGGLMPIPNSKVRFEDNLISATIINESDVITSATGGYFGRMEKGDYKWSYSRDGKSEKEFNNTFSGYVAGGYNVGGIVGIYSGDTVNLEDFPADNRIEEKASSASGTILGNQNVGGLIGKLELTKAQDVNLSGLINNYNVRSANVVSGDVKNVGGVIGYIDTSILDKDAKQLTLTLDEMANNGHITFETLDNDDVYVSGKAANFVGGIVGKLGAELKLDGLNASIVDTNSTKTANYILTNNINKSHVYGKEFVGGIIGSIASEAPNIKLDSNTSGIANTTINNVVQGAGAVGGIVGYLYVPSNQSLDSETDKLYISDLKNHSDISLYDGVSDSKKSYFGGIVGTIYSTNRVLVSEIDDTNQGTCTFDGVKNTGNVTGYDYVGGLFGKIESTSGSVSGFSNITIGKASEKTTISGNEYVGGIMGYYKIDDNIKTDVFKVSDNKNYANVEGTKYVGGMFGHLDLKRSYYTDESDTVMNDYDAEDANVRAEITNITNYGTINGTSTSSNDGYVGGIVGLLQARRMVVEASNLINEGTVSGCGSYMGGIFGKANLTKQSVTLLYDKDGNFTKDPSISESSQLHTTKMFNLYNKNEVTTTGHYVGGVMGQMDFDDRDTYGYNVNDPIIQWVYDIYNESTAIVEGADYVGGLFGSVEEFAIYGTRIISSGGEFGKLNYSNEGSVIGSNYVGGIVGYTDENIKGLSEFDTRGASITNDGDLNVKTGLVVAGSVTGSKYVGGLAGAVDNATVDYVISNATVKSTDEYTNSETTGGGVGGLVGYYKQTNADKFATITSSNNTIHVQYTGSFGNESAGANVGGLFGVYEINPKPIFDRNLTYVKGNVVGKNNVGGLFGRIIHYESQLELDFGYGQVRSAAIVSGQTDGTNSGKNIGGLIGYADKLKMSHIPSIIDDKSELTPYIVNAMGSTNVGGLVGYMNNCEINNISQSKLSSKVSGDSDVGGLVGKMVDSKIVNIQLEATINGKASEIGGLVGDAQESELTALSCDSSIEASGASRVGGLVGYANDLSLTSAILGNSTTSKTIKGLSEVGGAIGEAVGLKLAGTISTYHSVDGAENVGGVIGHIEFNSASTLSKMQVQSNVTINGKSNVGGLLGKMEINADEYVSVTNNTMKATVVGSADYTTGELVGYIHNSANESENTYTINASINNETEDRVLVGTLTTPIDHAGSEISSTFIAANYQPKDTYKISADNTYKSACKKIIATDDSEIFIGVVTKDKSDKVMYDYVNLNKQIDDGRLVKPSDTRLKLKVEISYSEKDYKWSAQCECDSEESEFTKYSGTEKYNSYSFTVTDTSVTNEPYYIYNFTKAAKDKTISSKIEEHEVKYIDENGEEKTKTEDHTVGYEITGAAIGELNISINTRYYHGDDFIEYLIAKLNEAGILTSSGSWDTDSLGVSECKAQDISLFIVAPENRYFSFDSTLG